MYKMRFTTILASLLLATRVFADGEMGIGPIKEEVKLGAIDQGLVKKGEATFKLKCSACHKIEERYVGPALRDVTKRRKPEWIMNMILNPGQMTQEDPTAQALLADFLAQMTVQATPEEARNILEFFRQTDATPAKAPKKRR